jgi:mycothiol synthase
MGLPKGFSTRPATTGDVEAVVELYNICSVEREGRPGTNVARMAARWQQPIFDQQTDTQVVLSQKDQLVGYAEVWSAIPYTSPFARAFVHPLERQRGIGTFLAHWIEQRTRQDIPRTPEGARVSVHQGILVTDEPAIQLLVDQGYEVVRYSLEMLIEMQSPPQAPQIPMGFAIQLFDRARLEDLVRADVEAFRDHWGQVERPFEEELKQWTAWVENDPDFDPSLWFVAVSEDDDEIVGMSLCRSRTPEDADMGWVDALSVRRPWRRKGLAQALLQHSFGELYRYGRRKVGLGVDAESLTGATKLYEKAGMREHLRYAIYEKELRPGEELGTREL